MKINKQLFEDVLSGKLKGTFVLKNGERFSDKQLTDIYNVTVVVSKTTYYFNGKPIVSDYNGILDIVDFIPDTDMKENELTIEIPNNKVVDWEESKKQNKIVLKDKQLTYEEVCKKLFDNKKIFYTVSNGLIDSALHSDIRGCFCDKNNATTEHQLECILAKNMLTNVAVYLNDGWKPTIEEIAWYIISYGHNNIDIVDDYFQHSHCSSRIIFKSKELAQQAIEILGEETIKLALEPLGF